MFHLPQKLGCRGVEHSQLKVGIHYLQGACYHLSRTKTTTDKLKSITGKFYYLKAKICLLYFHKLTVVVFFMVLELNLISVEQS